MSTPASASVKMLGSLSTLVGETINGFTEALNYKSLALVCFIVFVVVKYGL